MGQKRIIKSKFKLRNTTIMNEIFTITETAEKQLKKLMSEDEKVTPEHFLRVGVKGGGCSGLSYELAFDNLEQYGDNIFETQGIKVRIDKKSFLYLFGTELDFTDGLNGKGFQFINPNATRTCGCGESFAIQCSVCIYYVMKDIIRQILREETEKIVEPSERVKRSICDAEKFCSAQGPITFGQLKSIVENAMGKRIALHVGEGGYKATLRLLPWFLPQLALAGFLGATLRAMNKIFKPILTETTNYKTWWGKAVLKMFDLVEGELNPRDPFSRIFFISDGLMNMLDEENKVKFARYIAEVASEKPDDEPVPEFFVENELRKWVNQRFLLNPPLSLK